MDITRKVRQMYRRLDINGCGYGGMVRLRNDPFICKAGEHAKRKRIIGHQRPTHRYTGRCIETNDWVLGLLTTSSPSSSYNRRPSIRPSLSLSLFMYPSSGPCLSPLTAFLPHSEIPREQAMISNGSALRRRPCSFPFFSVRSSCSSSFCRGSNRDLRRPSSYRLSEEEHLRRSSRSATTARPPLSSLPYRVRRDRRYWSAIDLVIPAD